LVLDAAILIAAARGRSSGAVLAWSTDADIWTTDRDFAGTGVATWSTPNLVRALIAGTGERV
jgi:hypothetical protein